MQGHNFHNLDPISLRYATIHWFLLYEGHFKTLWMGYIKVIIEIFYKKSRNILSNSFSALPPYCFSGLSTNSILVVLRLGTTLNKNCKYITSQQWFWLVYISFSKVTHTPVFLITALDDYSEHLPSHFHTPKCRKLKFWFHIQFLILYKTR